MSLSQTLSLSFQRPNTCSQVHPQNVLATVQAFQWLCQQDETVYFTQAYLLRRYHTTDNDYSVRLVDKISYAKLYRKLLTDLDFVGTRVEF